MPIFQIRTHLSSTIALLNVICVRPGAFIEYEFTSGCIVGMSTTVTDPTPLRTIRRDVKPPQFALGVLMRGSKIRTAMSSHSDSSRREIDDTRDFTVQRWPRRPDAIEGDVNLSLAAIGICIPAF